MASLMEELLSVLGQERDNYETLLSMNDKKREAIVKNDIETLDKVTADEEDVSTTLKNLENTRLRILKDMAVVLGKDDEEISVNRMIGLLSEQPDEQKALTKARDELLDAASRMRFMNEQNEILLKQALEMVEFDLTLFKSLRQAPETANYGKNTEYTGDLLGGSGFDAKQ